MDTVPELITVDKPKGITSFGAVRRVQYMLRDAGHGKVKVGHAGTLDPLASGLMVLGIGKGTKQLATLIKLDKTYEAEVILGESRTTGDMEGEVVDAKVVSLDTISQARIEDVLQSMVGALSLPVPLFSAIKLNGQPLYKRARRGQRVEVPCKTMLVHSVALTRVETHGDRVHVHIVFDVGSGTYIRSLAEELGRRLGVPATLGNLRRTRVGTFTLDGAIVLTK